MRTRSWSIRSKIIALVAVPLTALLALWSFATAITAGPAVNLLSARTLLDSVGDPGEVLVGELQRERKLSVTYLSDPKASSTALTAQRAATDRAAADFTSTAVDAVNGQARRAASGTLESRVKQIVTDLEGLSRARSYIDDRDVDVVGAQNLYNGIVDTSFQMFAATATFGDEKVDREIRALTTVGRGQEHLSRVDSLLAGANVAGEWDAASRTEMVQAIGTSRFLFSQGVADLPERDRGAYQKLSSGAAFNRLAELQNLLLSTSRSGVASPVPQDAWQPAYDATTQQLRAFELNATDSLAEDARPVAIDILVRLGLAGLLGLAAIIVSIVVSIRVGRSIVGRLIRLRGEALEMADERLPGIIRRLQRGEAVDVDMETPPLEYGRDEIGQLGHAFNEVQTTAVQSAVDEANVRRGINDVFLNIARRSQTLLHRQLALLDRMERRETEPDELEDLYRVDHLATRMRRHAEDLVILAGAAPGRGWRNPVPLIDVIRGAISEVEDYKRIDIVSIQPSAVLGRSVGDVIHLIAELLENAASFSPPTTRVQAVGQVLPNGYAVEIEDRGLGMSAEAIAEANRKLIEPPDFDPTDSARLGLFVVALLAARHGIRVSLRPSAYGGVTAIVLIPGDLITAAPPGPGALQVGPSPTPQAVDQPLVGSGTDDRDSLAALQWQGTAEITSIPVQKPSDGTPTVLAATPQHPIAESDRPLDDGKRLDDGKQLDDDKPVTGPTPSAVADGLTADGLVQRRRNGPRGRRGGRAEPPAQLQPNLTSPQGLTSAQVSPAAPTPATPKPLTPPGAVPVAPGPGRRDGLDVDWPSGNDQLTHGGDPVSLSGPSTPASPVAPAPVTPALPPVTPALHPVTPALPPRIPAPRAPLDAPLDAEAPGAAEDPPVDERTPGDERLLPRRVRQANLVPQLRGPMVERAESTTVRTPEKVRSLMSALQRGTSQGRKDAAALVGTPLPSPPSPAAPHSPAMSARDRANAGGERLAGEGDAQPLVTDKQQTAGQPTWSEAATVTFPAVGTTPGGGNGGRGGGTEDAPEDNDPNYRPEKDA